MATLGERFVWRLNRLFANEAGGEARPAFFDIDETYPSLRVLDRNFDVIKQEVEALLPRREQIPRYHEVDKKETYISGTVDADKSWRVFLLMWAAGGGVSSNQAKAPKTVKLLQQVPGVLQAMFSILDPGKSIPAHDGPYTGYLRYHLPLKVPAVNPPSIRVKDHVHTWREGESMMFDDSWNHEVFNKSDDVRVVLIVDVFRPMRWHVHVVNWVVTRVLSRFTPEAREARANLQKFA